MEQQKIRVDKTLKLRCDHKLMSLVKASQHVLHSKKSLLTPSTQKLHFSFIQAKKPQEWLTYLYNPYLYCITNWVSLYVDPYPLRAGCYHQTCFIVQQAILEISILYRKHKTQNLILPTNLVLYGIPWSMYIIQNCTYVNPYNHSGIRTR